MKFTWKHGNDFWHDLIHRHASIMSGMFILCNVCPGFSSDPFFFWLWFCFVVPLPFVVAFLIGLEYSLYSFLNISLLLLKRNLVLEQHFRVIWSSSRENSLPTFPIQPACLSGSCWKSDWNNWRIIIEIDCKR